MERTEETPEHQSGVQIKFQFSSLRRHAQNIVKKRAQKWTYCLLFQKLELQPENAMLEFV